MKKKRNKKKELPKLPSIKKHPERKIKKKTSAHKIKRKISTHKIIKRIIKRKKHKIKIPKQKIKKTHHKEKEKRIPTGIKNFDQLIEKGFEKNSINMLVGGAGSGKSIFATQFLIEGMKKGEKCLYVTFEEKKERFYNNMLDFGWDLEAYEKKGLFIFLEYTPAKVKTMLEEGGGQIENIVIKNKVSRIVIDSITSFALLFEDELEKREAALSLFNMIREWSCTSLLTLEEEPDSDKKAASKALEFESDSIILIYFQREKSERDRYLEVLKMRGTKHSKKAYPFIIGKSGIVVGKRPISKLKLI